MQKILFALLLLIFSFVISFAQTPTPTPKPVQNDEDVVKISTNLIQVDVTVTDKNGKIVTTLKPEDFEIFENGEKQNITNFSFITSVIKAQVEATPTPKPNKNDVTVPLPPVNIRPEQVRRTIALVVDDLGLSFESVHFVRRALKKFVDEQMQPNDLIAIIRTGSGVGALQQFTSDKNQLYSAIDKIRWNPIGRAGVSAFAPIEPSALEDAQAAGADVSDEDVQDDKDRTTMFNEFREDLFSVGTLGAINFIVKGMDELPGRKSIMLFSDGFSICTETDIRENPERCSKMRDAMKQLTDLCNRASVTIYSQDARGLQYTGITAADSVSGNPQAINQAMSSRSAELWDKQEGLAYLANETGGRAVFNTNDLNKGLEKMLEDTKGYYLIAYQPDSDTFDAKTRKFNKLEIKLKEKGYNVRYRSGFFGVADSDIRRPAPPPTQTPAQQILKALYSPFTASGINMKLNTLFGKDEKIGTFVHSFLHVEAKDLKFVDTPEGSKKAVFDVLAVSFGENGIVTDQISKTYTLTVKGETYEKIIKDGFVYNFMFPIKKPGAYQMRVAIRDEANSNVGSANQFIEVPDVKKGKLLVSGIVLENLTESQWSDLQKNSFTTVSERGTNPMQDTSLRRFKRGTVLRYADEIYNAKLDQTNKPNLTTRIRIFRDGKMVLDGKPNPFNSEGQANMSKLTFAGALGLGTEMPPGDYVLQIIVIDNLAKAKNKLATQWIQFEIFE